MKIGMLYVLAAYPALSQVQHGSIGVVYFTPDKIVMAADSRAMMGTVPRDDVCKIAALGGDVAFVTTGTAVYMSQLPLVASFNNFDEIRQSYQRVIARYQTSRGHVSDIAIDFAQSLKSRWSSVATFDRPTAVRSAIENGRIAIAFIGGVDSSGHFVLIQVVITFDQNKTFQPVDAEATFESCPEPKNFCAIGETAIVEELLRGVTERAKQEDNIFIGDDSGRQRRTTTSCKP